MSNQEDQKLSDNHYQGNDFAEEELQMVLTDITKERGKKE